MEDKGSVSGILGRGWAWPPSFDHATGEVAMLQGEDDIRNSLELLMATRPGERALAQLYGGSLEDLVFEPMNAGTQLAIQARLVDRMQVNEPRIVIEEVRFDQDQVEGRLSVMIGYRVIATNNRYNLVFPYYASGRKEGGQ